MSIRIADYIPFDYMRYGIEILPALEQATWGHTTTLNAIIASATHFSVKLRSKYTLPLSEEQRSVLWQFHGLFGAATLRRIKAGEDWNPWEALAAVVPTLEGRSLARLGEFGEMLKYHLFATFCCEVPPWSESWSHQEYCGPILSHDEVVSDWHEYCQRDEQAQRLWEAHRQPASPHLKDMLRITNEDPLFNKYHPRSLDIVSETEAEMGITGFMTREEIQYLLEHVRTHERPVLDSIISGCIRDGEGMNWDIDVEALSKDAIKTQEEIAGEVSWHYIRRKGLRINHCAVFEQWRNAHPVEMDEFVEAYYERIHMVENEILHRMRFAAERGWGILKMSAKA